MSEPRICPECGSDVYQASHYQELYEARNRHMAKNCEQALEILKLQLRVAELEDERRFRGRKVEAQRRTIRRLEERMRELGIRPHEDKPMGREGSATPRTQPYAVEGLKSGPDDPATLYASPRGLRKMKKRIKAMKEKDGEAS